MSMLSEFKEQMQNTIEHLKKEVATLRTGRATPAIVEDVVIEAYGMRQPLKALASISVLDAKTIQVEPWDKSQMQAIDSGIRAGNLGFNPVNDGKVIRISLPDLTADRRQELIKVLNRKLEEARVSIRQVREDARTEIGNAIDNKMISEDEKFKHFDDIEKMTKEFNEMTREIGIEKEKEILTV